MSLWAELERFTCYARTNLRGIRGTAASPRGGEGRAIQFSSNKMATTHTELSNRKEVTNTMETKDRRIIFMLGDGNVICDLPLDAYEPGDIKETKEKLAKELGCTPDEIEVRITGLHTGRGENKGPSLKLQLIDSNTVKKFIKKS